MTYTQPNARILVPDGTPEPDALARVTHLGIGAHQDDLEFMATHGILHCFHAKHEWFGGVTCTDGSGSARSGAYETYSADEMQQVRITEQEQAARIGRFGYLAQLSHPSSVVKNASDSRLEQDIASIVRTARPKVIYTHNPADKHDTHLGVFASTLAALRSLPAEDQPDRFVGCEVWRALEWMQDDEKVALDVGGNDSLTAALNGVFDSQISGGKRYDLAVEGRKRANATFYDSHSVDATDKLWYAMDLLPLLQNPRLDPVEYVVGHIDRFRSDVSTRLRERINPSKESSAP